MLQDIRDKSQGIVVKIIVGFIVVTFALFGVEALVKSFTSTDKVAKVDGTDITRAQMLQQADLQRRQLIAMSNGHVNPAMLQENVLQKNALNELIQGALIDNQIASLKLGVSDGQVNSYLLQNPQFQTDGKFDQTKYVNFIRTLGFTPLAFKNRVRESILSQQLERGVVNSDFVLPYQVDSIAQLQSQERSFDYVKFSLADQSEKTRVTDKELKAYYDEHKNEFKTPEQVKINYVELTAADFANKVKVTNEDLQEAYKAFVAGLPKEERKASHILIDNTHTEKQAKAILDKIKAQLAKGVSFADLAKEYSDDIGSKKKGGELGYITQGTMVKPFEDALFSMKKGQVKEVKTKFGWHLIKLEAIKDPKVPSLADKKAALEKQIVAKKAQEALFAAHENISDLAYASDQLKPLANEYGVKVQTSNYFSRDGGNNAITSNASVISAAFGDTVLKDGQNSDLIDLGGNKVVVIHLADHKPESVQSFEQAKKEVTSKLVQSKAEAAIMAQAKAAETAPSTKWTSVKLAKRGQDEIASLAFTMAQPEGKPVMDIKKLDDGDLVLIRLNKVQAGSDKASDRQEQAYGQYLRETESKMNLTSQNEWLKSKADIETNL
ncbi:Peptidyl-prolyl cis-trans isomerase D [Marinomonas spartinae]|uniref:Periplasmic chaperone PpiD n=1 Tax=Marinomonas spartinae TaxID=1792290 RepID=A0A1A8TET9_9GAMM|nr:SurA N-terminal domain-containing protein [Marinomonas spartinae]SBS30361.1 Peptidyl-prolyl cis-trans isomerase D [Marinomonas spartinae]